MEFLLPFGDRESSYFKPYLIFIGRKFKKLMAMSIKLTPIQHNAINISNSHRSVKVAFF